MTMTMSIRFNIVAVSASLLISALATRVNAQERCTDASALGSYAFKVDGTNVSVPLPGGPGPFAAVGKNTYDGKGQMKGVIVVSSNGVIIPATYTGTYHVNADCTGSKSFTLSIGGAVGPTIDLDFVLDDDLHEIRMIISDPGFAVSGSARKLFTDAGNKGTEQE
jgi:hypothetical protein